MHASLIGASRLTGNLLLPPHVLGVQQTNSKTAKVMAMGTVDTENDDKFTTVQNIDHSTFDNS